MACLQVLDFRRILLIELGLQVIVCVENSFHVFVYLSFGFGQALLCSVELVLQTLYLVLELSALPRQEILILSEHINLSSE